MAMCPRYFIEKLVCGHRSPGDNDAAPSPFASEYMFILHGYNRDPRGIPREIVVLSYPQLRRKPSHLSAIPVQTSPPVSIPADSL